MILQGGGATPQSSLELVLSASPETKIVLAILTVFSLVSWFIIILKWWQFRRLNRQADKFFAEMERTTRLQEAYHAVMKQPPSPYNRLFREAITFYSELRPGSLREERGADRSSLSMTQLEALKMVLGKEVAAEREGGVGLEAHVEHGGARVVLGKLGRCKVSHILYNAKHGHVYLRLPEHLQAPYRIGKCYFLRRGHNHGARYGQRLHHRQRGRIAPGVLNDVGREADPEPVHDPPRYAGSYLVRGRG